MSCIMKVIEPMKSIMISKECHFRINGGCVFERKTCLFCSKRINTIEGITEMKDYVSIVFNKNAGKRSFIISTISLLISLSVLLLESIKFLIELSKTNVK